MSELALKLIEENKRKHAAGEDVTFLDLGNCGLTDELPEELFECVWLEGLNFGDGYFYLVNDKYLKSVNSGLPNTLGNSAINSLKRLNKIKSLFLESNGISDVGPLAAIQSLNTLDISDNQISDLTSIGALQSLNTLYIRYNQISDLTPLSSLKYLNSLYVRYNRISDIRPLTSLHSLKTIDVSYNQISDLTSIDSLQSLNTLYIRSNQIRDLVPFSLLSSLSELYISDNKIFDLTPLSSSRSLSVLDIRSNQIFDLAPLTLLPSLNSLDISYNQISDLTPLAQMLSLKSLYARNNDINYFNFSSLNDWPYLEELNLSGNFIKNIPSVIREKENCLLALKDYFKGINKEAVPVYESKLILIGDGRVGKTCLVKRLLDNQFNPHEPSTHAIQLRKWPLTDLAKDSRFESIMLNIWDFGGQDIYYATHRLFMQTDALFLLTWDAETASTGKQEEVLDNGKIIQYTNHSIRYWLSYIKALSNRSPVIIVQTKIDRTGKKNCGLLDDELKESNVQDFNSVSSSWNVANGFAALKENINQVIRQRIITACITLPTQWYRVRQVIAEMYNSVKSITLKEFNTICHKEELDESSCATLLEYLHNTGTLFYKKGLFNNHLILDQKWAIDAVYVLFDRKGRFTRLHGNGLFYGEDLKEVWQGEYNSKEQELFLEFMLSCEMCFELNWHYERQFEARQFIAPQLLPEDKPLESIASAFYRSESTYTKYKDCFLHDAVVQRFIVRTGYISNSKEMWQQGILLRPADGVALIEAKADINEITVRVKDGNKQLMNKIQNELKDLTKNEKEIGMFYSFDGENFVSLEKLNANPSGNENIQAENGNWVPVKPYWTFLNPDENVRFEKPKPLINKIKQSPKVFFSYAWNENSEKVVTRLYESLRGCGYKVVLDKKDVDYRELISEFMETIGRGDIIVIAISDKYLRSDNCMYELYELYRNSKLEKAELLKKIYPIRVESIKLNEPAVLRDYLSFWTKREEEYKSLVNDFGFDQKQHRKIEAIKNSMRDLLPFLNDINASTKEVLSADNFAEIKKAIEDRL